MRGTATDETSKMSRGRREEPHGPCPPVPQEDVLTLDEMPMRREQPRSATCRCGGRCESVVAQPGPRSCLWCATCSFCAPPPLVTAAACSRKWIQICLNEHVQTGSCVLTSAVNIRLSMAADLSRTLLLERSPCTMPCLAR